MTGDVEALWDEILRYIARYKTDYGGETPSMRQIAGAVDRSVSNVKYQLDAMHARGLLKLPDAYHHGIRLKGERYIPPPET